MTLLFWSCALMTLLSGGVSAGFSLQGLLGPGSSDNFARYAASRSIAVLFAVLIAIGVRSRTAIAFLGIAMVTVQLLDGVIGILAHDPFEDLRTVCVRGPQRARGELASVTGM